jgi:hypothetical protein
MWTGLVHLKAQGAAPARFVKVRITGARDGEPVGEAV